MGNRERGLRPFVVNHGIRLLFQIFCDVKARDLAKIPLEGPAILISNHTSNIEGPFFYVHLRPRPTIAMAKVELWNFLPTRLLMNTWKAVPIRRGRMDRKALGRCTKVLERGEFLCIAPEGTRSKDGTLLRGQPGATWFALDRKIPIYPMVQWGCRDIGRDLLRFRRPKVTARVGRPFYVKTPDGAKPHGDELQAMADEMMYQMAALMPPEYRGHYSDLSKMTTKYLEFL